MAAKQAVKVQNGFLIQSTSDKIYEVPTTLDRAVITTARIVNLDSDPHTLQLWIVTSGAGLLDRYQAYINLEIPKESTKTLSEIIEEPLTLGSEVHVQADISDALTITLGLTTYPST